MDRAVTVIGDALVDVHVRPSATPRPDADVPAEIRLEPGGQGANLAVRLARRGLSVRLRCALASDAAGQWLRSSLEADGVNVAAAGDATGSVVVIVGPDGARTMLSHRIPLVPLLPGQPEPAAWRVVSGYVLVEGEAAAVLGRAAPGARTVVAGCALAEGEHHAWLRAVADIGVDLLVLNAAEAAALAPEVEPGRCAAELSDRVGGLVVVTDRRGASVSSGSDVLRRDVPWHPDGVDSTGAGDAFTAGLVATVMDERWPPTLDLLERGLDDAARLAASVARVPGAQGRVEGEGTRGDPA